MTAECKDKPKLLFLLLLMASKRRAGSEVKLLLPRKGNTYRHFPRTYTVLIVHHVYGGMPFKKGEVCVCVCVHVWALWH